jgi:hypothetical protein
MVLTSAFTLYSYHQVPKDPDLGADAERVRREEQKKIDEAEPLTEEEVQEKEDLLRDVSSHLLVLFYFLGL